MLAMPCAINSTFGLCRSPLMRSATTADISDSMAPSMATVIAGDRSFSIRSGRNCGTCRCGMPPGMPPNRDLDGLDWKPSAQQTAVAPNSARTVPGMRPLMRRMTTMKASDAAASPVATGSRVDQCLAQHLQTAEKLAWDLFDLQAEEVLDLGAGDQHGDAVRETDDDRTRNELDHRAHAGDAESDEQNAGDERAHEQPVDAILGDDAGDHDDERAGRPADLAARATKHRDEEAGDDRAVQARLGRHA